MATFRFVHAFVSLNVVSFVAMQERFEPTLHTSLNVMLIKCSLILFILFHFFLCFTFIFLLWSSHFINGIFLRVYVNSNECVHFSHYIFYYFPPTTYIWDNVRKYRRASSLNETNLINGVHHSIQVETSSIFKLNIIFHDRTRLVLCSITCKQVSENYLAESHKGHVNASNKERYWVGLHLC